MGSPQVIEAVTGGEDGDGVDRPEEHPVTAARTPASPTAATTAAPQRLPRARTSSPPRRRCHSHSMVPGGLLVMSSTTRFTSRTSLVMRVEILASTSYGTRVQSAVIASSDDTGRSTTGWP